jgi:ribosomal protein L29
MDDTAKVATIKKDVAKLLTKLNKKELIWLKRY